MNRTFLSRLRFVFHPSTFVLLWITLYAVLALGWIAFGRWVVPPLLTVEHPGPIIEALMWIIHGPPALFLPHDILACWHAFAGAVLIAAVLHLTIILILRSYDLRSAEGGSSTEVRARYGTNFALAVLSLGFLAVAVLSGPQHDYYFYSQIWYEVRQGHDPWFTVPGTNGIAPLNAYGPLFNLLAGLSGVNPLAPKLLFAYAYVLFAIGQIQFLTRNRPPSTRRMIVLTALFWNPFPWVEVAIRGHFDVLVALFCLGAIRAWVRGSDGLSGISLALGVLLKYFPVVLLPFLAIDRGRFRARFLVVAVASIAVGLALSCELWGMSTLLPLKLAATRRSTEMSIFFFMRGRYSPLRWFGVAGNYDDLSPLVMGLALLRAWSWYRVRQRDVETAAVVAVVMTVILYRTGYPQYQMVPFVLGSSWVVRHWSEIGGRIPRVVAIASYFGWLAAFDLYYAFIDEGISNLHWDQVRQMVGLPTFVVGCAFVAAVVRFSTSKRDGVVDHRPESLEGDRSPPRAEPDEPL